MAIRSRLYSIARIIGLSALVILVIGISFALFADQGRDFIGAMTPLASPLIPFIDLNGQYGPNKDMPLIFHSAMSPPLGREASPLAGGRP